MTPKIIVFSGLLVFASFANAGDLSGTYSEKWAVPGHSLGEEPIFYATIKIKQLSKAKAKVSLSMLAPTAGSSCGGQMSGMAAIQAHKAVYRLELVHHGLISGPMRPDRIGQCRLVLEVYRGTASVISDGCWGDSGMGCAFEDSARFLKKIK